MYFAAVILAGGRARRIGGIDKVMLDVGGRTLLDRSLAAVAGADPIVVVGPRRPAVDPPAGTASVVWTREEPPGAGPLAALGAGLSALPADGTAGYQVAVLAGDLLGITPDTVTRLRAALADGPGAVGAVLIDDEGYRQWLHGVWWLDPLRAAVDAAAPGRALGHVFGRLPLALVPAGSGEAADVDTPDDLP